MFKYVDRKKGPNLVLISGWAFDHKIFEPLDLPFNYYLYCGRYLDDFGLAVNELLKIKNFDKISILGWSKGAYQAADFACRCPEIIDQLFLVGVRKRYDKQLIESVKKYVRANRRAFLNKFYRDCFGKNQRQNYLWFKKNLQKKYINEISEKQLLLGLDQLANMRLNLGKLRTVKNVKIIHGKDDEVAPSYDAAEIAAQLPLSRLIVFEDTGHLPFLHPDFRASVS